MKSRIRVNLKIASVPLLVAIVIFSFGFQVFAEEWSAEQKEVWNVLLADIENFKKGDVQKIMDERHDDLVIWWNTRPEPFDKELAPYRYSAWFKYDIPKNWELNPLTIKISGNIAIIANTYKFSGEKLSENGRLFSVLVKQNNKWLLLGSSGASCEKPAKCQE